MMDKIANPQIQELAEVLAERLPTAEQVREAIALAYAVGKNDGALEANERMLANMNAAKVPK